MKTPITEAIEQIKKMYENENITGFSKRAYAQCLDILESKLPKEKEIIEKAVFDTMAQGHINLFMTNKIDKTEKEFFTNVAKTYFNETFTQK